MLDSRRISVILMFALCFVYVAVRLWRLTDSCLWFDEIFSIHAAEHPWGKLFWFVAQDLIHPPLFYVLLKLWISIAGENLLWLRLFPVLFSVAALVPFILLCRELKLKTSSILLALAFFAVNGSLIKYAQEVRMYSLLLCLSLFSIWLFARFFFRGKNIWILTLVNILLVYTHYFGWFVVVGEIAGILILQRIKIRHVLTMLGIALVTYIPWIFVIVKAANSGADVKQNIGWIASPNLQSILDFAFDVVEPFYFQQSNADASTHLFITLPLLVMIASAKMIYLVNWKKETEKNRFYLLAILSALPLLFAFVLSWILPVSIWGSRHLIIVFAPAMIVAAIYVTEISIKPLRYFSVSTILSLTGVAFVIQLRAEQPKYIWCAWEKLGTEWITTPHYSSEPKRVYVFEDLVAYHFWFEIRGMQNYQVNVMKGMEGILEDTAYFLPRGFDDVGQIDLTNVGGDGFWIAFRDSKPENPVPGIPFITRQKPPLSTLSERGFVPADVRKMEIGHQVAYLIRMQREPEAVPRQ